VAVRLARLVDSEGATPSTVRELRYALLALDVRDLGPFVALMAATKQAIDASDDSLPTIAAQLREQEQTLRKLSSEPANAPAARAVRDAVDGLVALWQDAADRRDAGHERDWDAHRERSRELWEVVDAHGGSDAFPDECDRSHAAFMWYFRAGKARRLRRAGVDPGPIPEGIGAADAYKDPQFR
jgi:hypothetical protein